MDKQNNIVRFPARGEAPGLPTGDFRQPVPEAGSETGFSGGTTAGDLSKGSSVNWSVGEIADALEQDRLVVHYQPQFDIATGRTVAAEALVRLLDRDGKLVMPDRFIGLTEDSELIVLLGRAVIRRVCVDLAALRADGLPIRRIAINVSAHQLELDQYLLDFVAEELEQHGLCHADLEFELTERQLLKPGGRGLRTLKALHQSGSGIVLDDLGIGYSSLQVLEELPFRAFKLDRSMIRDMAAGAAGQQAVADILVTASRSRLGVIAEGIETHRQLQLLKALGCRWGQGFGYAWPMPVDALGRFLANQNPNSWSNRAASA